MDRHTMVCPHLAALEQALLTAGIGVTFRGQAWSQRCREWVYFDCVLERESLRSQFSLPEFVIDHDHLETHDGQESGFVCTQCWDGVLGRHVSAGPTIQRFG